jgi:hypothetical protein
LFRQVPEGGPRADFARGVDQAPCLWSALSFLALPRVPRILLTLLLPDPSLFGSARTLTPDKCARQMKFLRLPKIGCAVASHFWSLPIPGGRRSNRKLVRARSPGSRKPTAIEGHLSSHLREPRLNVASYGHLYEYATYLAGTPKKFKCCIELRDVMTL